MGYVYKDMERLRFWCQKVLPTVYDDSLSYYELLTKVVQYLNDTVENVNTLIQQVADIDADLSNVAIIDDSVISPDYVWSSQKSNSMMNSKIIDSVRNAPAPANTGSSYSCKYITDNFAGLENGKVKSSQIPDGLVNTIDSVSLNGVSVTPDADKNVNIQAVPTSAVGEANGVPSLDANGKVPSSQLPSYVDDVVEGYYNPLTDRFYEDASFEHMITPTGGKCWVDVTTNKSYRWTGSGYVRVDEGVQLGETSDTAYAGNKGKANADAIAGIEAIIPNGASASNKLVDGTTLASGLSGKADTFGVDGWTIDWLTGIGVPDKLYVMEHDVIPNEGTESSGLPNDTAIRKAVGSAYSLMKDTVGWSGKNLLENKASSQTINGITFTVNADGSVEANGTATADAILRLSSSTQSQTDEVAIPNGSYILSGTDEGSDSTYYINIRSEGSGAIGINTFGQTMIALSYTIPKTFGFNIVVKSGTTVTNQMFYPMFRKATFIDGTFEPYRGTTAFPRDEQRVLGAKNVLPITLTDVKKRNTAGTWSGNAYTFRGVTYTLTINDAECVTQITTSGTATGGTSYLVLNYDYVFKAGMKYTLSGCGKYGQDVWVGLYDSATSQYVDATSKDGVDMSFGFDVDTTRQVRIRVGNGIVTDNFAFYPMIRLASDTDPTYVPFAMTNRELTDKQNTKRYSIETASGYTISTNMVYRSGNVVNVLLQVDTPSDLTVDNTIGIIPFIPATSFAFLDIFKLGKPYELLGKCFIRQTNGNVIIPQGINITGSSVFIFGTYICQD